MLHAIYVKYAFHFRQYPAAPSMTTTAPSMSDGRTESAIFDMILDGVTRVLNNTQLVMKPFCGAVVRCFDKSHILLLSIHISISILITHYYITSILLVLVWIIISCGWRCLDAHALYRWTNEFDSSQRCWYTNPFMCVCVSLCVGVPEPILAMSKCD